MMIIKVHSKQSIPIYARVTNIPYVVVSIAVYEQYNTRYSGTIYGIQTSIKHNSIHNR
jgi:hypothetical protein